MNSNSVRVVSRLPYLLVHACLLGLYGAEDVDLRPLLLHRGPHRLQLHVLTLLHAQQLLVWKHTDTVIKTLVLQLSCIYTDKHYMTFCNFGVCYVTFDCLVVIFNCITCFDFVLI